MALQAPDRELRALINRLRQHVPRRSVSFEMVADAVGIKPHDVATYLDTRSVPHGHAAGLEPGRVRVGDLPDPL